MEQREIICLEISSPRATHYGGSLSNWQAIDYIVVGEPKFFG